MIDGGRSLVGIHKEKWGIYFDVAVGNERVGENDIKSAIRPWLSPK